VPDVSAALSARRWPPGQRSRANSPRCTASGALLAGTQRAVAAKSTRVFAGLGWLSACVFLETPACRPSLGDIVCRAPPGSLRRDHASSVARMLAAELLATAVLYVRLRTQSLPTPGISLQKRRRKNRLHSDFRAVGGRGQASSSFERHPSPLYHSCQVGGGHGWAEGGSDPPLSGSACLLRARR